MSTRSERRLAGSAVTSVARTELRRHWVRLLAVGVAAGLLGAVVVGLALAARRTATAYDRLAAATEMEDAAVSIYAGADLLDEVRGLEPVEGSTVASMFVGRIDGPGVVYLGIRSAPPDGMGQPVVIDGRAPSPDAPDEVLVLEELADELDLLPGSSLGTCLLTTEEFASFDTGFGDPDGPCTRLTVTGVGRVAGSDATTGIYASPAFAERYGEGTRAGSVVDVRVADADALAALGGAVDELAASTPPVVGAEEFPTVALSTPADSRAAAAASARVLVGGLIACAVVATLVGLLLVGQALGRQFAAGAADQRIEAALGLTPLERCLARVAPATLTAAVATVITVVGALAAGAVEPLGPLGDLEPRPGWAPNVAGAVLGAGLVAVACLGLAALAAARAGRVRPVAARTGGRHRRRPLLVGGSTGTAGIALALGRRRGPGRVPLRTTLATVTIGVAGVVATLVFAASLDRVGDEPARWGWNGDVVVVDAQAATAAAVAADPRVASVSWLHQVEATLDGAPASVVTADEAHPGGPTWTVVGGRLPSGGDEVVLGTRLADRLGVDVGDAVDLALDDGGRRALRVVGTGIGPSLGRESFAGGALVAPDALDGARTTGEFNELLVLGAPGADLDALVGDLATDNELGTPAPPPPVQDLLDLGRMPSLLALYLGLVAAAALANGLAVMVRRRRHDLASLRAVGLTPRQVLGSVLATALASVTVGVVVGVPLGLGLGRLVWWVVADRTGLATDASVPVPAVLATALGAVVVGLVAAAAPGLRAARLRPAPLLRVE